jgi:MFS transporter, Spinster family, sphingosine-1-phosphate transporter
VYTIFPILREKMGFTNSQLGLTGSLFIWATGLAAPFAGKLNQRYSTYRLIMWNLVLWSVVTGLTGLSTSPGMLLSARALLGITEALFIPLAVSLIASTMPPALRSRAVGLFFSAQLCGVVAGGSVGGWIAERFGWRVSFFALGILGSLFAIPLAIFFRTSREPISVQEYKTKSGSVFVALARIPSFVALCICFPVFLMVLTILYAWLPNFFHEKFGLGLAAAAFRATFYLQTGTALGLFAGSIVSDRLYSRKIKARFWLVALSSLFGAPWAFLLTHGSLPLAELSAAGFGLANGTFTANLMIAPFDVVPSRARTYSIAVINTIAPPFAGLASFMGGVWKDRLGIPTLITILSVLMVLCGIVLLVCTRIFFEEDRRRIQAELLQAL